MPETQFARDGFAVLAARLGELGARRVLILTGPSRRFADRAVAALGSADVFDGATVHVPAAVVERAATALRASGADWIVAIGGGSAIGLGKALRLAHDVRFAAMPTTYAGSEMTSMYGVTRERDKQTGRDERVRPDLVVYDVELARELPLPMTAQSMLNAIAHVASVLGSLDGEDRAAALAAAHDAMRALEDLVMFPRAASAREAAARGASACARAFDRGKAGAQHALAHLLGGALGVEHAPLHAILLPHFLAHLRAAGAIDALEQAIDRPDLDAYVHDLLVRAGAPVALTGIGGTVESVEAALATRPELPAAIARDAMHGLRPPGRGGRISLGGAEALVLGPAPARAKRIVIALHGRGAEAGTIARRLREIAGHDPDTCVLGLRAHDHAERWYAIRAIEPGAGRDPEVVRAIARVDGAVRALPAGVPVIVAGFSQGACLALEYAARHGEGLAAVLAFAGVRIGRPDEWAPAALTGVPVLVGADADDRWCPRAELDATIAWLAAAGARVDEISGPGADHAISLRQRLRARELILGRAEPAGLPLGTIESEARAGAIPPRQNTPRRAPFELYPEQVNGTGFTAPRGANARSWLYRVRPSSQRRASTRLAHAALASRFDDPPAVDLVGFAPLGPARGQDFVDGLVTLCGAGDATARRGYAFHRYAADRSMNDRAFYDADGDLLILPEQGSLTIVSEFGPIEVAPGALCVIPKGVVFSVLLRDRAARGYVAEPFGRRFALPERGPIGANGLVDPRHLCAPHAWFEDRMAPGFRVTGKLGGALHDATQDHSPFDAVGWHGSYAPYTYDLADFSPSGNTAFDHGDPSVYTVLTAPLDEQGAHTLDLVVFPARWDATAHTFRPPFFHRNAVAEINGIVREQGSGPFVPGCAFITPPFTPHGVSGRAVERSRNATDADADRPHHHAGSLWFQLESALAPTITPWSRAAAIDDWAATWGSHRGYF